MADDEREAIAQLRRQLAKVRDRQILILHTLRGPAHDWVECAWTEAIDEAVRDRDHIDERAADEG